ncbi:hypothetical protein JYU34_003786 [Plutella xylostella]|uniref:Peptidase S1 domain-containing protein n=1 Tax=Plutella xylostella TaxID=51655 RepID=A0ABQ7R0X9_PLUXY|nr:hypothetical protein JYU34_003786 [Plutella xylostella]
MICAVDVGSKGACNGDSGGPLYHNGGLVGVVSFGSKYQCASKDNPGGNTRVSAFTTWILDNIDNPV